MPPAAPAAPLLELTAPPRAAAPPQTFFINPEVGDYYRIDSILCLADAKHIQEHLHEKKADDAVNEAVQQVAFADRILLNKARTRRRARGRALECDKGASGGGACVQTDLVSKEALRAVREEISSINAYAEVIETVQSRVELRRILGVSSFSVEKTLEVDPHFLEEEEEECTDAACTDPTHCARPPPRRARGGGLSRGR